MARRIMETPRSFMTEETKKKIQSSKKENRKLIMLDDVWGLEFIPLNITIIKKQVIEKGDNKGKEKLNRVAYYGTMEAAVMSLHGLMVRDKVCNSSISTIEGLKDSMFEMNQKLLRIIPSINIGELHGEKKSA